MFKVSATKQLRLSFSFLRGLGLRWAESYIYSVYLLMACKLDEYEDDIVEAILEGKTFEYIANYFSCSRTTLFGFLNSPNISARAQEAFIMSAHIFTDKAIQELESAKGKSMADIMIAREISQYYMKMASFRNRAVYGDKIAPELPQANYNSEDLKQLAAAINQ